MQVEQYQNFSISYEGEDFSVTGMTELAGENIADNGGGKTLYETFYPFNQGLLIPNLQLGYSFFWCTLDNEHEYWSDYRWILNRSVVWSKTVDCIKDIC